MVEEEKDEATVYGASVLFRQDRGGVRRKEEERTCTRIGMIFLLVVPRLVLMMR